jgi:glutamyl-tRNA reductase
MSASSAAVALATSLAGSLTNRTVLVIGAGEAGRLALSRLAKHDSVRRLIASRSPHHARRAAEAFDAEPLPLDGIEDAMACADVVIAAVQTPTALVTETMCRSAMAGRAGRALVVVDLSMPHAVDTNVAGIPGVTLRTIDDLGDIARQSAERRLREIPAVEAIALDEARRACARVRQRSQRR